MTTIFFDVPSDVGAHAVCAKLGAIAKEEAIRSFRIVLRIFFFVLCMLECLLSCWLKT
jgi:hypothetical protein